MKYLKPLALLLLVFIAGVCVGVVGTRIAIRRYLQQAIRRPELVRLRIERDLVRELNLDPAQQQKLDEILTDFQRGIAKARAEHQPRVRFYFFEAQRRINEMLRPDQQQKFEELQAQYGIFSFGSPVQRMQRFRNLRDGNQNPSP